jgi:hypothetical protein
MNGCKSDSVTVTVTASDSYFQSLGVGLILAIHRKDAEQANISTSVKEVLSLFGLNLTDLL